MNNKAAKTKYNRIFLKNDKLSEEALNACKVLHIDTNLLMPKTKDSFKAGGVPQAIADVRYYHYEEKRKALLDEIEAYLNSISGFAGTKSNFMRR